MRRYAMPPRLHTGNGARRRVGFELEFAGLAFKEAVQAVSRALGMPATTHTQAEASIHHPQWGTFVVEVDSELAKSLAQTWAEHRNGSVSDDPLAEWVVNLTTELVPVELGCPPIAIDSLAVLDPLISGLRECRAQGTSESPVYAFGVHINPELPSLQPAVIGRYLKAYAIAQDWLVKRHRLDLTRRATSYVDLYPGDYRLRVLDYDDTVSLDTLLDDYLLHNATRNRALDMLPLFKHLAEESVTARVSDPRVKPRPTLHYRLPNCEIDRGDWHLSESWNIWCVVEVLAGDATLLEECAAQYRDYNASLINLSKPPWFHALDDVLASLVFG